MKHLSYNIERTYLETSDEVTVILKDVDAEGKFKKETFKAIFAGCQQITSYVSPLYKFLVRGQDDSIMVRLVNPHEIKEIRQELKPEVIANRLPMYQAEEN
jgi:hypothetical protein